MNCAELEILLCDYAEGSLRSEQKFAVEEHLAGCSACALMVQDARDALSLIERAAVIDAPPELMTRIVHNLAADRDLARRMAPSAIRRWWARLIEPVLQPRVSMGMAMTVLSFAMLWRFAKIDPRPLRPSDLDPAKVLMSLEDRAMRTWARGVKYYENLRLVYEIQTQLKEWSDQAGADTSAPARPGEASR